ncbi:hypothetical protein YC2023_021875 [Brassica napus]
MNRLLFCRGRKLQANLVASVISRLMRFELQVSLLGREYDEGVHDLVVFNAMISGKLVEAYDMIKTNANAARFFVWGPSLGACRNESWEH